MVDADDIVLHTTLNYKLPNLSQSKGNRATAYIEPGGSTGSVFTFNLKSHSVSCNAL